MTNNNLKFLTWIFCQFKQLKYIYNMKNKLLTKAVLNIFLTFYIVFNFSQCSSINNINNKSIIEIKPQVLISGDFDYPIAVGSGELIAYYNYFLRNRFGNYIDQIRYENNKVILINRFKFNQSDYGIIGDIVPHFGKYAIQTNNEIILFENEKGFREIDRVKIENVDNSLKVNDIIEPRNESLKFTKEFIIDNNIICINVNKLIGHETFKRIFPSIKPEDEIIRTYINYDSQNVIIKRQIKSNMYELIMINANTNLDSMYENKNLINTNNFEEKSILKFNEDRIQMNSFAQSNPNNDEIFFSEVGNNGEKTFAYLIKYKENSPTTLKFDSLQLKYLDEPTNLKILYAGDNFMLTYHDNEYNIISRDSLKPLAKFINPPALNKDIFITELYNQKDGCNNEKEFDSDLFICINSNNAGGQISVYKYPHCDIPQINKIETYKYSKLFESNELLISNYSYKYDCFNSRLLEIILELKNPSEECISDTKINIKLKNYNSEVVFSKDIIINAEVCPNEQITYRIPEIENLSILSDNWCNQGYIVISIDKKFSERSLKE